MANENSVTFKGIKFRGDDWAYVFLTIPKKKLDKHAWHVIPRPLINNVSELLQMLDFDIFIEDEDGTTTQIGGKKSPS